ncbi:MAG: leucine-rich repeat domain-containing protein [Bacteroidales bacterium]|nr:leucine-rich repeat domain-containing protein [Bacteroidales bacterium]
MTSIIIPDSITALKYGCFEGCNSLTSITIPNSVTSLAAWCFARCTGLTSITIPNSVTSLGHDSFYGCDGLASITIPNSVTTVGDDCFSDADYLIYCYQNLYDSLRGEYGERVMLFDSSAIGQVEVETAVPSVTGYYDLSGRRFSGQQRGLNIIRYSDGTSRKVMVK